MIAAGHLSKPMQRLVGLLALAVVCVVWEIVVRFSGQTRFPSFSQTAVAVVAQLPVLLSQGAVTLSRALAGFALALVTMIPAGILIARTRGLAAIMEPLINLIRPLPPLATIPVIMLFAGPGSAAKIAVVFYGAAIPILLNTIDGVRSLDPMLVRVSRSLRLSRTERFLLVDLPATLPRIVAGARLSLAVSLLIAISAEMLLSADGLGTYLVRSQEGFRIADGMAGLLFIAVGSLAVNALAGLVDQRLLRWHYLRRGLDEA